MINVKVSDVLKSLNITLKFQEWCKDQKAFLQREEETGTRKESSRETSKLLMCLFSKYLTHFDAYIVHWISLLFNFNLRCCCK